MTARKRRRDHEKKKRKRQLWLRQRWASRKRRNAGGEREEPQMETRRVTSALERGQRRGRRGGSYLTGELPLPLPLPLHSLFLSTCSDPAAGMDTNNEP